MFLTCYRQQNTENGNYFLKKLHVLHKGLWNVLVEIHSFYANYFFFLMFPLTQYFYGHWVEGKTEHFIVGKIQGPKSAACSDTVVLMISYHIRFFFTTLSISLLSVRKYL